MNTSSTNLDSDSVHISTQKKSNLYSELPYSFEGIFETHIIVKSEDQAKLFAFCADKSNYNKDLIKFRPSCAQVFYGKHPNQPMISYWYHGKSDEAVQTGKNLVEKMEKVGMTITRLKVESVAGNKNIKRAEGIHYFEFHFKIETKDLEEWNKVADICAQYGSHFFFNPYSRHGLMQPVITIRRYDCEYSEADQNCKELIKSIVEQGFKSPDKIHGEFSVLDSNVWLDEDWLFKNNPKNFLLSVPN